MIKQQYNPVNVVPDKDPKRVEVSELIDALNMRVGVSNPLGGSGVYRIAGNAIITNPLLPSTGTNKAVGWCADRVNKRLYFANWNSVDANDTIYEYSAVDGFRIVLRMDLEFSSSTLLSMDYNAGYLVWTSSDIEEPRQVNVERGINTFLPSPVDPKYQLPIDDWQIFQLHRPPAIPLEVTADVAAIANEIPKPVDNVVDEGYQFAYNYEYINNIESRLSEPTGAYWNNELTLTIPTSEVAYLNDGSNPNPYIVAVRFYFRVGNTGDWTYFQRQVNDGTYSISTTDLTILSAIGTPSIASLLGADGVPRRAEDLLFADSRLVLAGLTTGYDATLPAGTTTIVNNDYDYDARGWQFFAPLRQVIEMAAVFITNEGRIIGTKSLPPVTLWPDGNSGWQVDVADVYTAGGGGAFDLDSLPWDQMVDYLAVASSDPFLPSQWDIRFAAPKIRITPSASSPSETATVVLATKSHRDFNSFNRTQSRPFFIYKKGVSGEFTVWLSNTLGENFIIGTDQYQFYGIGFEFASGEPINFSTEQNYYIQVIGSLYTISITSVSVNPAIIPPSAKPFKITDQIGNLLVSKQNWASLPSDLLFKSFSYIDISGFTPTTGLERYGHALLDVALYSKNIQRPATWNRVPNVFWTKAEWDALTPKDYFGDCYGTGDSKTMSGESRVVQSEQFSGNYTQITSLPWQGFWSSMNLNGIFQETWASDIGSVVVLDPEPQEQVLSSSIRHSEQYLTGTKINNIFTFDPLNQTNTQSQLGSIVKMVLLAVTNNSGNNIYVWCKSGVEMIYLGRTQQTGTDGDSVMSLSTNVFGSHNVLKGDYGIGKKTQAVMTNKGIAFGFDVVKNILVQLSNNGLDPVSDQKYFKSHALDLGVNSIIGYDPFFREALVKDNIEGIAYNFESDFFQGRRSYNLDNELFAWLTDNQNTSQLFSMLNGELYEFNTGTQIHGQDYTAMVQCVVNVQPELNKELFSVKYSGSAGWKAVITNLKGQQSTIRLVDFQDTNGVWDGSVKRDENSVGGLISGQRMEDVVQFISLQDEDSNPKQIVSIETSFIIAQTNLK
jgi:hypothetical protein